MTSQIYTFFFLVKGSGKVSANYLEKVLELEGDVLNKMHTTLHQ